MHTECQHALEQITVGLISKANDSQIKNNPTNFQEFLEALGEFEKRKNALQNKSVQHLITDTIKILKQSKSGKV